MSEQRQQFVESLAEGFEEPSIYQRASEESYRIIERLTETINRLIENFYVNSGSLAIITSVLCKFFYARVNIQNNLTLSPCAFVPSA